jgi:hypothetical protein
MNRLPLDHCRKSLKGLNLSDQEVIAVRDFLYTLAKIEYDHFNNEYDIRRV